MRCECPDFDWLAENWTWISWVTPPFNLANTAQLDFNFCQVSAEADWENELIWFMKKLWIITDICHLELYDPNRFHFASRQGSESCREAVDWIFSVSIISVSQKWVRCNRGFALVFPKQSPSQVFKEKCQCLGCLQASFHQALSLEKFVFATLPFPPQSVAFQLHKLILNAVC